MNQLFKIGTKQALKDSWAWDISPEVSNFLSNILTYIIFGIFTIILLFWIYSVWTGIYASIIALREPKPKKKPEKKSRTWKSVKVKEKQIIWKFPYWWLFFLMFAWLFPYILWAISTWNLIPRYIVLFCILLIILFLILVIIIGITRTEKDQRELSTPIRVIVVCILTLALIKLISYNPN